MTTDARFLDWKDAEEAAEGLVPMIGRLYRDHGVLVRLHGARLVHQGPLEIVKLHRRGHRPHGHDVALGDTRVVLEALLAADVAPAEIDVGTVIARADGDLAAHAKTFAAGLPTLDGGSPAGGRDVVLYGFGRIGRILARQLVERAGGGEKYNLRAVVVRKRAEDDLERRANLLRADSVHGAFEGSVETDPSGPAILVNGTRVQLIYASSPDAIDYTAYGIHDAIVIDNTGKWRDRAGLSLHLASKGVSKVILTAPGKGDVPNLVYGINHTEASGEERVLSAASCTTNAIVPVLHAVNEKWGIVSGHLETVHAYTNDQNLIDNYHPKARRGRGAALNLVITETGAAKAVAKALPELAGKLTGNAIRVPTPNVSLAIMNLRLGSDVTTEAVNAHLHEMATSSDLKDQIGFTANADVVSSDLVGEESTGVVDGTATIAHDDTAILYVWYDNEYGYACQVMRLLGHASGMVRPAFP